MGCALKVTQTYIFEREAKNFHEWVEDKLQGADKNKFKAVIFKN